MENALEILFESAPKVRLLRLFMHNSDQEFALAQIQKRCQMAGSSLKREVKNLLRSGVIKERIGYVTQEKNDENNDVEVKQPKGKKAVLYFLNKDFSLLGELRDLVLKSFVTPRKHLLSQIRRLGRIKLAVISGIFIGNDMTRTDLLIVGEDIKARAFSSFLARMESEMGKSLRYTVMDTEEFKYRRDMYDRFLRDVLEFPHEKLINKLNI